MMAEPSAPAHDDGHDHREGHARHEHGPDCACDHGPAAGDDHAGQGGHDHAHHGGGGHSHAPASFGRAFAIGIGLNTAFVVVEVIAGLAGHSVALLADAGHNVSDILGLVVAWLASILARRLPSARFTYGLGGTSILAALFNALFLLVAVGALSLEAVQRLVDPAPVAGWTVMIVAACGVAVNGVTAWLFASGRDTDINIRGAYLHMLSDALVSVGVIAAGGIILMTGWLWLDPVTSLAVNAIIVFGTWSLLRDSFAMSVQGVPPSIEPAAVRARLASRTGVTAIHDLHVWPMSTTAVAMTCHLTMPGGHPGDAFLHEVAADLEKRFGISHVTLQVETDHGAACPQGAGHATGRPAPGHAHAHA